jgi:hypothetical protein
MSTASSAMVLEQLTRSPQKYAKQCARLTGISRSIEKRILKRFKWKVYKNKEDPDRRVKFCEWLQHKVHEDGEFVIKTVWSDEATFKLNGTVNRHNCVYWAPENPYIHVDKAASIPGLTVWCGLSYRAVLGPLDLI